MKIMNALALIACTMLTSISIYSTSANAGMSYECWSYKGGDLGKMVHVVADDRNTAARLAAVKFDDLSVRYDQIKCK